MDATTEPVFRANKRRKVYRKRADSEDENESGNKNAETAHEAGELTKAADYAEDFEEASALRLQRRSRAGKYGIGFSSAEARRATQPEDNMEAALVPVSQDAAPDVQIDRFVRPMGREMVTEDKNMMAYVDSKLAEMRSTATAQAEIPSTDGNTGSSSGLEADSALAAAESTDTDERTFQSAQARSDRVYQRPAKRPRRKKYERGDADIARDAYIDEFMQEAQVPMYDQPSSKGAANVDTGGDNDAATAEAFKAQLLQDMQNRRRRPPKAASAQAVNTMSGPKLGGSRQQRERMRAMQEAEGKK